MKIAILTLAINEWYRDIVKYSLKNIDMYCKNHNYDFIYKTEKEWIFDNKRQEPWYKIKLIEEILNLDKYDWICWIDADTQILIPDKTIEYFIDKLSNNNTEIIINTDNLLDINTGLMFIKQSEFNKELMKRIWNYPCDDYFKSFHEQTVLSNIFHNENDEFKNKFILLNPNTRPELIVYWGQYYPNLSFLIHCAKCSHDQISFSYMMDTYYIHKMDEETDDDYKERMDWLYDINKCRNDIDKWITGQYCPRKYSKRCKQKYNL